ncbi:alpha/beta hydrolase [Streptomyces sp. AV19]|nr:alpha/beta hydrolase [Streptomyces sp. AV19]MBH1938100.1 alpha/beta hydrolase [Streptomyces sp. AV19]MDG4533893.1 alpha/beta fold hydrolase [Streptomyces sp. AV19]
MSEEKALNVGPSGIEVAYERFGDPGAPPVMLVMGGGGQMINWPEEFCAELVGHGLQVIRFDNRDSGRSTHFHDAPVPDLQAALAGDLSSASYTLSDMAADAVGLLDVLGLDGAHFVGASLGGMIAQTVAIECPERIRSLTSMMSNTGDLGVGQPDFAVLTGLGAPPEDRQGYIGWYVRAFRVIGSPGFPYDEAAAAERAGLAHDRGLDPLGLRRQAVATVASGDRTARLRTLDVPALVIHGAADVMCDISGGRATAAAIPGAELITVEGMGHNFPRGAWPQIIPPIVALVRRAEKASSTA